MIKLSPSILSADFGYLAENIQECAEAGAPYVHVDVMDGLFVPSISIGMPVIKSIRRHTGQVLDVHLMIQDPIRYIDAFADAGSDIITFHLEAAKDPGAVIDAIHAKGKKAGLSIKPATPVSAAEPYLKKLDMLLIMSVEPGFGGQQYIPSSTEKIRQARHLIDSVCPGADLEVDGGIKTGNVEMVLDAGANVIVAGSAVFGGDIRANTKAFLDIAKKRPEGCLCYGGRKEGKI
jgi:ribulose-phosphate 3-epimerase